MVVDALKNNKQNTKKALKQQLLFTKCSTIAFAHKTKHSTCLSNKIKNLCSLWWRIMNQLEINALLLPIIPLLWLYQLLPNHPQILEDQYIHQQRTKPLASSTAPPDIYSIDNYFSFNINNFWTMQTRMSIMMINHQMLSNLHQAFFDLPTKRWT